MSAYNDATTPVHNKFLISMTYNGHLHHLLFIIVTSKTTTIIALAASEWLQLIKCVY